MQHRTVFGFGAATGALCVLGGVAVVSSVQAQKKTAVNPVAAPSSSTTQMWVANDSQSSSIYRLFVLRDSKVFVFTSDSKSEKPERIYRIPAQ